MPVIARFYGLIIKMFFLKTEHNPPHIHVVYGEYNALIDITKNELIAGDLPYRAVSLVQEWVNLHKDELLKMWKTQEFKTLEPLK